MVGTAIRFSPDVEQVQPDEADTQKQLIVHAGPRSAALPS